VATALRRITEEREKCSDVDGAALARAAAGGCGYPLPPQGSMERRLDLYGMI
jgi:hypothetical protein